MFDYFESHKDSGFSTPDHINVCMPFKFRKPVEELKDIRMVNDMAGVGVQIAVMSDFERALKATMSTHSAIKKSLSPFCTMVMV